ncbi:MAG TPA: ABC transporter substrate-binding protein [bacterium]|nr:ABC transporter substrate-binding protein [bacterium]
MLTSVRIWLHVTCALVVVALACPPVLLAQTPTRGGTLIVGVPADLPNLDPHRSALTIIYTSLSPLYQPLVELAANLALRPELATSWNVSPDGLTWTFNLRHGVLFHNGREMTSADVKFAINRILDPKTGARGRGDLSPIESIATPDKYTVLFKLKSPFGVFPNKLATTFQGIVPPEAVDPATNQVTKPIGTGPFRFDEWKTNDHLSLKRWDRYWEPGKPYLDGVMVKPITDETVRLTALQTGDIMISTDVPQARLEDLFKHPSSDYVIRLNRGGAGQGVIALNTRRKPFDNVKVRQAIAYAINKQELVEAAYRGWGHPVNQNFTPSSPWYLPVKDRAQDLARAKQLLAEAGLPGGLKATMIVGNGYGLPTVAQVFQAQVQRIGVTVDLQLYDIPTWSQRFVAGDYDFVNTGFFAKVDPDDAYYRYLHTNGGAWSIGGFISDPALDQALDQARAESDPGKQRALYVRVVQTMQDDASMLIFGSGDSAAGWRTTVHGFVPQLIGALSYAGGGVQDVWLSK